MPTVRLALVTAFTALLLAACGSTTKPVAGTPRAAALARKGLNDPRTTHIACLRADHVTDVHEETINGLPSFQVGTMPVGPTVEFLATPGMSQGTQIAGQDQGAERIGSAMVFPNAASAKLAGEVETFVGLGVSG